MMMLALGEAPNKADKENTYDMVVYFDLIFLINMLYQFGILWFTNRILHYGRSVTKIVISSIIQCLLFVSITVLILDRSRILWWGLNLASSVSISVVLFRTDTVRKLLRMVLTEMFLCISLGGILTLIHTYTANSYLLLTATGSVVFLGLFVGSIKELFAQTIGRKNCLYDVRIIHREKEIRLKGLLDSGNGLTDPISGEPVCILTHELCKRILKGEDIKIQHGYRMVPYHAIGKKNGILEAFFIDGMEIRQTAKGTESFLYHKVLCAVSPDDFSGHADYEMILHPKLLG